MIPALWKLREWLTIDEAAQYLSSAIDQRVGRADVLRLALDGKLTLVVHLPPGAVGGVHPDGTDVTARPRERTGNDGLWDLSMDGPGRVQVEHEYHWQANLPYRSVEGIPGAWVERGAVRRQLTPVIGHSGMWPKASSALCEGAVLGVRTAVLDAFAAQVPAPPTPVAVNDLDKPLGERERTTLLTIIAALADFAKLDLRHPSKAAQSIESMTSHIGARISARAIENHLKRTLELHRKTCDED